MSAESEVTNVPCGWSALPTEIKEIIIEMWIEKELAQKRKVELQYEWKNDSMP
jgi:hypothetical protein